MEFLGQRACELVVLINSARCPSNELLYQLTTSVLQARVETRHGVITPVVASREGQSQYLDGVFVCFTPE